MRYPISELNKEVTDLEGKAVKLEVEQGVFTNLNVRNAFRRALGAIYTDEQQSITFEKKMQRFDISKKIWTAETQCDLKTEEQAELKLCVGKMYSGEVLGFLEAIIEQKM